MAYASTELGFASDGLRCDSTVHEVMNNIEVNVLGLLSITGRRHQITSEQKQLLKKSQLSLFLLYKEQKGQSVEL